MTITPSVSGNTVTWIVERDGYRVRVEVERVGSDTIDRAEAEKVITAAIKLLPQRVGY